MNQNTATVGHSWPHIPYAIVAPVPTRWPFSRPARDSFRPPDTERAAAGAKLFLCTFPLLTTNLSGRDSPCSSSTYRHRLKSVDDGHASSVEEMNVHFPNCSLRLLPPTRPFGRLCVLRSVPLSLRISSSTPVAHRRRILRRVQRTSGCIS